jgi:hypothetical protein
LHAAPLCRTFTMARRRDKFGTVRKLRSADKPNGIVDTTEVREANAIAHRTIRLCRAQHRAGGWFTIENPDASFLWKLGSMEQLLKLPSVELKVGDQCCLGGHYKKSTGWATNAPCMSIVQQKCPGQPEHPRHPNLSGFIFPEKGT